MPKGEDITTKFKVDVSDLKKGITQANQSIKMANAEFKAASAGMDDWKNSSEGLEAKLKQLDSVLQAQKSKLDNYKTQLEKVENAEEENGNRAEDLRAKLKELAESGVSKTSKEYKEYEKALNDVEKEQLANQKTADNLRVTILNQQATVSKTEKDIRNYSKSLDDVKSASSEAESGVTGLNKDLDRSSAAMKDVEKDSDGLASKLSGALTKGFKALATAAAGAVTALIANSEASQDYIEDMGKLDAGFKASGHSAETAKNVYEEMVGILGETDQAVEASNHLAKLTQSTEELSKWTDISAGVYAAFGDSLPLEGLTEAANETAKVAKVTGPFADTLNWVTMSTQEWGEAMSGNKKAQDAMVKGLEDGLSAEDAFNLALQACSSEQERSTLITNTLYKAYKSTGDMYRETNGDLIDARKAQSDLSGAMADLARDTMPVTTEFKKLGAEAIKGLAKPVGTELLPKLTQLGNSVLPKVESALKFLINNVETIAKLTLVGASAWGTYKTATLASSAATKAAATIEKIMAVAKKVSTASTKADTAATVTNTAATVAGTTATNAATVATKLLALAQKATPWGAVLAGITAVAGALIVLSTRDSEETKQLKEQKTAIDEARQKQKELNEARQEAIESGIAETDYHARLKDELTQLVDANGKVKEGYEARAGFIVGQLNEAYGTEMSIVDGVIQKYDEQMGKIDELISKKRAQIIVEAGEEAYTEALKKRSEAYDYLVQHETAYNNAKRELSAKTAEYMSRYHETEDQAREHAMKSLDDETQLTIKNYEKQQKAAEGYTETIATQEEGYALLADGSAESLEKINTLYSTSYKKNGDTVEQNVQREIAAVEYERDRLVEAYKKTGDEKYKSQIDSADKTLESLNKELDAKTSAVKNKGPEEVAATAEISQQVVDAMKKTAESEQAGKDNADANVKGMQSKSGDAKKAGGSLAESGVSGANGKKGSYKNSGGAAGGQFSSGLSAKSGSARSAGGTLGSAGISGFGSKDYRGAGGNAAQGIASGAANKKSTVGNIFASLGTTALDFFKKKLGIKSPSRAFMKATGFIIDGIVKQAKRGKVAVQKVFTALGGMALEGFERSFEDVNLDKLKEVSIPQLKAVRGQNMASGEVAPLQGGTVNNFYQTINSPKPLSRLEIYRQSKNLLSTKV